MAGVFEKDEKKIEEVTEQEAVTVEIEGEEGEMEAGAEESEDDAEETGTFFGFCEEAVSLLLMAYLFIIFCMYPFYMQDGYVEIGNVKYNFYKSITIGAFALIIPLAVACTVSRVKTGLEQANKWRLQMSFTDCAVLAYGCSVVLSFICSDFKTEALWGERGWNMGLITQLLFVISYFLVSRFWEYEGKLLLAFMAAASGVFLLGLLNRFSVFPIEVRGANSSFLSTLGNINWYCGYWSVLFPIGFMLYWCGDELWLRLAGLLGTVIGIATGVSQGSTSAFIVFGGLYIVVFCLSFKKMKRMKRFLELAMLFCLTCQGLRLWRILLPEAFDYYDGTFCDWITMSRATLYVLVVLAVGYGFLCLMGRKGNTDMQRFKILRQIAILLVTIVVGVYLLLLVLNSTTKGGIRFMGDLSALVFSKQWGSSRGATWSAGAEIYRNMPILRRVVGAGPDCFAMYLYTLPDLAKRVIKQFDGSRLTNAHNEWLTVLVNNGILGLLSYAGIFGGSVVRWIYHGGKALETDGFAGRRKYLYIFAMSAFAYTIHNVVSFQQILSTPLVFLMLGMGESLMRRSEENR